MESFCIVACSCSLDLPPEAAIVQVIRPSSSACVLRDERVFNEDIPLMQVDVGEKRAEDAALRGSAVGFVIDPLFEPSCFQAHTYQVEPASIMDISGQDVHEHLMVEVVKAAAYVALD